jgi:hypothetical protein
MKANVCIFILSLCLPVALLITHKAPLITALHHLLHYVLL